MITWYVLIRPARSVTQCIKVPTSGIGDAESLGVVIDVRRVQRLEQGFSECTLQFVEPPAYQDERSRAASPADKLTQIRVDAVLRGKVGRERVSGDQELDQGAELHDQVVGSVPGGGGPAVGLGPTAVRRDDDLSGMARAFVGKPGEPAVLADLSLVELGAATADQYPAGDQWLGRRGRVPVEPAAEQVLAAATDPVQTGRLGGVAGIEADDTVRALIDPFPELFGSGDLGPVVETAAEDGRGIPVRVVVQCSSRLPDLLLSDRAGRAARPERYRVRPLLGEGRDDAEDPLGERQHLPG